VLTLAELEALDPLMGTASFFTEALHPGGAVENPHLVVNARGTLEDGRSFTADIAGAGGHVHRWRLLSEAKEKRSGRSPGLLAGERDCRCSLPDAAVSSRMEPWFKAA